MPRMLLIDDDKGLLKALSEALHAAQKDLTIDLAFDAEQALLLIGVTDYDVIVSDVRMPGMDGLELVAQCQRLRPDSPVVLMTGYDDRDVEVRATQRGAYAFLHKPVDADALLSVVSRALIKARLLRRNLFPASAPVGRFSNETEKILAKMKQSNDHKRQRVRTWVEGVPPPKDKKIAG